LLSTLSLHRFPIQFKGQFFHSQNHHTQLSSGPVFREL
jgi:hypothetical protein